MRSDLHWVYCVYVKLLWGHMHIICTLSNSTCIHFFIFYSDFLTVVILNTNNEDRQKSLMLEFVNNLQTVVIKYDTDQSACFTSACSDLCINHVFNPSHVP